MLKKLWFSIVLSLFAFNAYAQDDGVMFRRITVADGLSQSWVRYIYKDSYGYMWIATGNNGVNQYNSYNFNVYKNNPKNTTSISSNTINVIYEDKYLNLWFGTSRGLCVYNRNFDRFTRETDFERAYVIGIHALNDGRLFVITPFDFIVYDWQNKKADYIYNQGKSLSKEFFTGETITLNDSLYLVSTNEGPLFLNVNNFTFHPLADQNNNLVLKGANIRSMLADEKGNIWIGTNNRGLYKLFFQNEDYTRPIVQNFRNVAEDDNSITDAAITRLELDDENKLWIAVENNGIDFIDLNYDGAKPVFKHIRHNIHDPYSISENSVHALYKDNDGLMWVGTYSAGINYYNRDLFKFSHIRHLPNNDNGLNNNHVNVIYEEENYLWVGTQGGLNRFDTKNSKWEHFTHNQSNKKSLGANPVWSILRDSRGNLWVGAWAGGLNLFDEKTKTFTRFINDPNNNNSLSSNNVFSIIEVMDGELWVATMNGGINQFNYANKTFKRYQHDEGLSSLSNNWVKNIVESSFGEIWIATSEGLDLFDKENESFIHFLHNPDDTSSLSNNQIIVVFEDSKRNIWVGTEYGLNLYNRAKNNFTVFYQDDGLPNSIIRSICEDDRGNLWIGTNKGLSKFIGAVNNPINRKFKNYDIHDGLQGNEFISRSSFKNKEGRLYFGGINGLNYFHPDSIMKNLSFPEVVFTNLYIYNRKTDIGAEGSPLSSHISFINELVLNYKQSVFSIGYTALNYRTPDEGQYAFILEGFDNEWNYVGKQRLATYTNLNPGKYTFRVKAANADGEWAENSAILDIVILPPWWKTLFFKVLIILSLASLITGFYFYRINILKAQKGILEELVKTRTKELEESNKTKDKIFSIIAHDLKSPFTTVLGFAELLKEKRHALTEDKINWYINTLYESSKEIYGLLENLLEWSRMQTNRMVVNPRNIKLFELADESIVLLKEAAALKQILVINSINKKHEVYADTFMINAVFRNLLANAVKFTPKGGEIKLNACPEGNKIKISVKDNGTGISNELLPHLFNMEERITAKGTEGENGSGLGLVICKDFIQRNGGNIWAVNNPGRGATFYFILPQSKN